MKNGVNLSGRGGSGEGHPRGRSESGNVCDLLQGILTRAGIGTDIV
jgi:hypothetical protein